MAGVTHFERRDRQPRQPAECGFCAKKIKATPKRLAGHKGDEWVRNWLKHLNDHIMVPLVFFYNVAASKANLEVNMRTDSGLYGSNVKPAK